jgi:hypothetical protein
MGFAQPMFTFVPLQVASLLTHGGQKKREHPAQSMQDPPI